MLSEDRLLESLFTSEYAKKLAEQDISTIKCVDLNNTLKGLQDKERKIKDFEKFTVDINEEEKVFYKIGNIFIKGKKADVQKTNNQELSVLKKEIENTKKQIANIKQKTDQTDSSHFQHGD